MDKVDVRCDPKTGTIVRLVSALTMRDDAPIGRLGRQPVVRLSILKVLADPW